MGLDMCQNLPGHPINGEDRSKLTHEVDLTIAGREIFGRQLNGKQKFETNSMHHQGFLFDEQTDLTKKRVIVYGKTRGNNSVIEAMGHMDKPIISVQWHPEEIYDEFSNNAVAMLLKLKK